MSDIDWPALRAAATEAMRRAYAPYSRFPVGAAALVDDGRVVVGCNVESASYGVTLCAECGVVSALHAGGGGRLVALCCVHADGGLLLPCGRCRQLLWEHGGPHCLIDATSGPLSLADLLPHAFDRSDLEPAQPAVATATGAAATVVAGAAVGAPEGDSRTPSAPALPEELARWQGHGTVFVHPDMAGGQQVWTGYWERSSTPDEPAGILEEGPNWASAAEGVAWGRARTPRVVVVEADGTTAWAGTGDQPNTVDIRWAGASEGAG